MYIRFKNIIIDILYLCSLTLNIVLSASKIKYKKFYSNLQAKAYLFCNRLLQIFTLKYLIVKVYIVL